MAGQTGAGKLKLGTKNSQCVTGPEARGTIRPWSVPGASKDRNLVILQQKLDTINLVSIHMAQQVKGDCVRATLSY